MAGPAGQVRDVETLHRRAGVASWRQNEARVGHGLSRRGGVPVLFSRFLVPAKVKCRLTQSSWSDASG